MLLSILGTESRKLTVRLELMFINRSRAVPKRTINVLVPGSSPGGPTINLICFIIKFF